MQMVSFNILGGITLGILMARLVEFPIIRLRDRFFPATQSTTVLPLGILPIREELGLPR
jgi:hypothetical protein